MRRFECDVCIIGGGITAAMLAEKLSELKPGLAITVVEAGKSIFDFENRQEYRKRFAAYGENPWPEDFIEDQSAKGIISRTMAVGGSALHWGGTCNRFSVEDLRLKSMYGLAVDWPIEWAELERYYCEAEQRLGVSGEPGPFPEDKRSEPYPMRPMPLSHNLRELKTWAEKSGIPFWGTPQAKNTVPYGGRQQCIRCNTCSICPTGARYSPDFTFKQLLERKKIALHEQTLVRKLVLHAGKSTVALAQAVDRRNPDEAVEYRARQFVLAAGYTWSPHLLLLSGLANRSGHVGRYMNGHAFLSAQIELDAKIYPGMNEQYGLVSRRFFRCPPDKPFVRHDLRIWESSAGRQPRLRSDDGRLLLGDALLADWRSRAQRGAARVRAYYDVHPSKESTLTLDEAVKNRYGDPMPKIEHKLNEASMARRPAARKHILDIFGQLAKANSAKILSTSDGSYLDHPAGGCRMGNDPSTSVCDSYGRTHDHENLFVVGAPTLPTAGCTNGTLTFVALTLRSAARIVAMLAFALCAAGLRAQQWPVYGNDPGGSKYSPLDQINRSNVGGLKPAWEWKTGESPIEQYKTFPGVFQATPIMIDGVLYLNTPYNRVVALDSETGRELWSYDPKAYEDGQPPNGTGFVHRGVAAWRDGAKLRIFINSRYRLICLDAETGKPVHSFGDNGIVNLTQGLMWETNPKHYTNTSPPVVHKDLVILGNGVGDRLVYKNDPPGDVRAWNARTGKMVWSFHTVPQKGEFGNDTWEQGSEKITGHTNVWAPFTADEQRGLVYLPVSTPSNDFYGVRRPGANLFAESIVCLDANTGKRRWHYQIVHHGLWDYDLPSPPNVVTINVNGRKIDAVVQLAKMGFVFVFDRLTGKPVWPIEERPVPRSDVPGEHSWPTQPFPTKPAPIADQGVSLDDAFDLTPELKLEAQAELKKYRIGPLYTPPSFEGTLMRPGIIGGANWGGGAFDPETGILYVKTSNTASLARLAKALPSDEVDAEYTRQGATDASFHNGLPLVKPPYGQLSAVDLNRGQLAWRVTFGDMPQLRKHPALDGVTLPEKFGVPGAQGVIVTKGGIVFAGGGDLAFHAVDKSTGRDLWTWPLSRRVTGTPMTYRAKDGRQYVVVATTGAGRGGEAVLMAFALER